MIPLVYREYLEYVGAVGILAGVYFLCAKFGLSVAYVHPSATTVWAPTGIALVALLLFGFRYVPGIFIGAFLANITTLGTTLTSLGIALGNTLEAVVFAYLVLSFAGGTRAFERTLSVFAFIVCALVATTISASLGVVTLTLAGFADRAQFETVWLAWWLGDIGGALLIAPFILMWWNNFGVDWNLRQLAEVLGVLAAIFATSYVVFGPFNLALDFLAAPVLIWLVMRFPLREALSGMLLFSALAIGGTLNGFGPFASYSPQESLLYLQAFIVVATMSVLVLSAMVSERKTAAEALQKADQAKDDFLAMLSHELRNPLASIVSHVQLLQLGAHTADETKALHNMHVDLRHTTALLEDLLDLSRIRRGRIRLRKEPLDLTTIVREVAESFKPIMNERGLSFNIRCGNGTLVIHGDRSRIKQIIVNLLSNASKFTDRGNVTILCHMLGSKAVVSVTDTGVGITSDRLVRLLDTDVPVTTSMRHSRGGLGLGLALVKRLADMHDATLEVESQGEGKGSTFSVLFPILPQGETSSAPTGTAILLPAAKPPETPKSVLVVDDNKKAADALSALLHTLGYEAHALYDGASALDHLKTNATDVVILDIGLPDMSGHDVAENIHAMPGKQPLLVALSGYGTDDDVNRSREVGFAHHLVKPVDVTELQNVLRRY
jgi:signal transduction histidine kinase/CheY-like chemotaxis protein